MYNLPRLLKIGILSVLPLCLTSCAHNTIVHPLDKEFYVVNKGDVISKDGFYVTGFYLDEICGAKIDRSK